MDDFKEKLRVALIEQHKLWFDYNKKALKEEYAQYINCPVCGSNENREIFKKDWFSFLRCNRCSMVYVNPRLNDEASCRFYNCKWTSIYNEQKFNSVSTTTNMDDQINLSNLGHIETIRGSVKKKGKLLELGSGNGTFLRAAKTKGYEVYSVELNESNCQKLKNEFGGTIYNSDLFEANFNSNTFDVIYMRDVFEHIPNPKELLLELNRVAKANCIIVIEVPNIDGLIYKIAKEKHVCIFGFEHLNYWSPKTLRKILNLTGFKVIKTLHNSLDCSMQSFISYFWGPLPFTSIKQRKISFVGRIILKIVSKLFRIQLIKCFDKKIFPRIANLLKRGSVITVIAKKNV
ncbi:class I SAM-dependent methyltransferase [candidate division KSB1 bacterium]|nr:class I SAM-dependent methyltransferase [candidate division KSB1 bacterium]